MEFQIADNPEALIRGTARVGEAEIIVCTDGTCRFDGGAMFGVVPRTLWSKVAAADEQNRVTLGLNCVVVRLGGKTVLIETGFGNKLPPKLKAIYDTQELLPQSLAAARVRPEDVDFVINTHLHWDHCGWNTVLDADGTARPYFPNATYVMHRGEVEHGRLQTERDGVSYVPANYEVPIATGQAKLIDAKESCNGILGGISVECFPGHTQQTLAVHIKSQDECATFISDLLPTSAHLPITWVMAFDLDPLRTITEKKRFYSHAAEDGRLVLFPHDHSTPMGVLRRNTHGVVELNTAHKDAVR